MAESQLPPCHTASISIAVLCRGEKQLVIILKQYSAVPLQTLSGMRDKDPKLDIPVGKMFNHGPADLSSFI